MITKWESNQVYIPGFLFVYKKRLKYGEKKREVEIAIRYTSFY